ncbi:MAG: hypothetical protein H6836_03180 [Planctomycetes bacterium]|nr:hypothetical protein [Planctomycetota bacterium]MCB9888555.1 hypothetical protein [Planctomycetota bacterium]
MEQRNSTVSSGSPRRRAALAVRLCGLALLAGSSACSVHLFSGVHEIDRSRPVARIEVRGQADKLGATTTEGVVFLSADGASGDCRVHYFLGPDVLVDDGVIRRLGGVYDIALIDLKTQAVPVLDRELADGDKLVALVWAGRDVERITVRVAHDDAVTGYALEWPGRALPRGTGIFLEDTAERAGQLTFVGLASGLATLRRGNQEKRFITFTGPARMREALAVPRPSYAPREVRHRPDGISISR